MTRRGGVLGSFDGRVTVRVPIPGDLLAEVDRIASASGVDRAVLLGDLVAQALPEGLAEAARDVLAPHAETLLTEAKSVPSIESPQTNAEHMISLGLPPGVPGRGTR